MKVTNNIPSSHIISETKINPQSLNKAMRVSKGIGDWLEEQRVRNLNEELTDVEKIPEAAAVLCGVDIPKGSTKEYNNKFACFVDGLFRHTSISVVFTHVSKEFICDLTSFKLDTQINVSSMSSEEIGFWVNPSVMDDDIAAVTFGKQIHDTGQKIEELKEYLPEKTDGYPHEIQAALMRLVPIAAQTHAITTTTVSEWREIIYRGTQMGRKDEMRYILLDLARRMNMKYPTFFQDMKLIDNDGNKFGFDTLGSSDTAWRDYAIELDR